MNSVFVINKPCIKSEFNLTELVFSSLKLSFGQQARGEFTTMDLYMFEEDNKTTSHSILPSVRISQINYIPTFSSISDSFSVSNSGKENCERLCGSQKSLSLFASFSFSYSSSLESFSIVERTRVVPSNSAVIL
mgnify:CR=1 FL=1